MRRTVAIASAIALLVVLAGCHSTLKDLRGKENAWEHNQRRYTELVRWGEIERAAAFVDPEHKEQFLSLAPGFQGIRVTDVESGPPNFDEESDTATVYVVYHAYSLSTFLEKRITEKQEWHRDEGMKNTWWVKPDLGTVVTGAN